MWQEIGRSLIAGGQLIPETYKNIQDDKFQYSQRQQQLEDMIQRRIEAKDTAFRAQQEESRRQREFQQKQDRIAAEEKVRQKMIDEQNKRIEQATRAAEKEADRNADKALQKQQQADLYAQQTAQALDKARSIQGIPTRHQRATQPGEMQEISIQGGLDDNVDQQINQMAQDGANRFHMAGIEDLESNPPQDQTFEPWTAGRLARESFQAGATGVDEYEKSLIAQQDRAQGGRFDKKTIPYEEKAQLAILKEDLRAGRPLTEWQKQILQLRSEELGLKKKGLGLSEERLSLAKEDQKRQETSKLTNFVKNTKDQAEILYAYQNLDKLVPGGIYGTDGIAGYGFGTKPFRKFWKTDEANKIRPGVQALINKVLKQRSGAAVTEQELNRLEQEFGVNTTGTIEEFRQGLQNYYEAIKNDYDRFVTADQESARRVDRQGYGQLKNVPKVIEEQRPQQNLTQPTWTSDKARRLAELRAKRAAGRLQ